MTQPDPNDPLVGVSFSLPLSQARHLDGLARLQRRRSRSAVLRDAVQAYVDANPLPKPAGE